MEDLKALFEDKMKNGELSSYDSLLSHLDSTISILENESESYRPRSSLGKAGGLIDFSAFKEKLPVVVVPDLHGREKFLVDILKFRFSSSTLAGISDSRFQSLQRCEGLTVLECLEKGLIYVCCVGDIFHSESRGKQRWINAFEDYSHGNLVNSFMQSEMRENLSLLEMLLILKSAFAGHFHILKGNHENILNEMSVKRYGNVPFRKFCDEGNMVADFLQCWYDDLIIHEISCFEKSLPVCAVFDNLVVSHAEPSRTYSRKEIVNYHDEGSDVVFGLTWTANDKAECDSVPSTIKKLLPGKSGKNALWIGGHRPVIGKYALRQGGAFVQIHNPDEENIAIAVPENKFDPLRNILCVEV